MARTQVVGTLPEGGVESARSCTDCWALVVFIVVMGGWGLLGAFAYHKGDVAVLLHPVDYEGHTCGSGKMSARPVLTVPNANYSTIAICTETCPPVGSVLCRNEFYSFSGADLSAGSSDVVVARRGLVDSGACWVVKHESTAFLRKCYPVDPEAAGLLDEMQDGAFVRGGLAEVDDSKYAILFACVAAGIAGLLWVGATRVAPTCAVRVLLLLLLPGAALVAVMLYFHVRSVTTTKIHGDDETDTAIVTLWCLGALAAVLGVVSLVSLPAVLSRTRIAAEVLSEGGGAIGSQPSLLLITIPALMALSVGLSAYWAIVTAHLASITDVTDHVVVAGPSSSNTTAPTGKYKVSSHRADLGLQYLQIPNLFCFLWGMNTVGSVGYFVIASTVIQWYFSSPCGSPAPKVTPKCGTFRAAGRLVRYHAGSVTLGSLLALSVGAIREVVVYLEGCLSEHRASRRRVVSSCAAHFASCVDAAVRPITKANYVMVAMYGLSYWDSGKRTLPLLTSNQLRLGGVSSTTSLTLFLSKLSLSVLATALAWYMMAEAEFLKQHPITYGAFPLLTAAVLSYFTSSYATGVYDICINATLMCYFLDDASNEPYHYTPPELSALVEKYAEVQKMRVEYDQALKRALYAPGTPLNGNRQPKTDRPASEPPPSATSAQPPPTIITTAPVQVTQAWDDPSSPALNSSYNTVFAEHYAAHRATEGAY